MTAKLYFFIAQAYGEVLDSNWDCCQISFHGTDTYLSEIILVRPFLMITDVIINAS